MLKRVLLAAVPVASIAAGLWIYLAPSQAPSASVPDRRAEVMAMLADGRFDDLDARLNAISDAVNAQSTPESELTQAFGAFATSDPAVVAQLEAWVTQRPKSAVALIARGANRFHQIEITRHIEPLTPTSRPLADELRRKEHDAFVDVQRGLGIKEMIAPGFSWSLAFFIESGQQSEVEYWYRIAVNDLPKSPEIHRRYLSALVPWRQGGASWQDSLVHLKEVWEGLRKGFGDDPDFQWLNGYFEYVVGESYRLRGRTQEAIAHLDAAVQASKDPEYLLARARARLTLGQGDAALQDFDQAAGLDPQPADAIHGRGLAKSMLSRTADALADFDAAVKLDPKNPLYLVDRARTLRALNRPDEAQQDVEDALLFGRYDPWVQVWRGAIHEPHDVGTAAGAFKLAADLGPDRPPYLKRYAEFLLRHGDCAAVPAVKRYRAICKADESCAGAATVMDEAATALVSGQTCPM